MTREFLGSKDCCQSLPADAAESLIDVIHQQGRRGEERRGDTGWIRGLC